MNHIVGESATSRDPLAELLALVPARGRVLVAGLGDGRELAAASRLRYAAEGFDVAEEKVRAVALLAPAAKVWRADVRLLSVPRESYDGVFARGLFAQLDPPGCQRALGSFFATLRPGGALFAAIRAADEAELGADGVYRYPRPEFASLLRQSGFQILAEGRPLADSEQIGYLARRI